MVSFPVWDPGTSTASSNADVLKNPQEVEKCLEEGTGGQEAQPGPLAYPEGLGKIRVFSAKGGPYCIVIPLL